MADKEWQRFKVAKLSDSSWGCQPLKTIEHVAHVPTALRIAEDSQLRADLIFDESRLKTERIRVVWLSPNDWDNAGGFRYGNVRFSFDWSKLVTGKRYYWVESIAYGIEACRILVTDIDWSKKLEEYDPDVGDGPWWRADTDVHYWNGNKTLEIMFEGDLPLSDAIRVDFVTHHRHQCSIDPKTCSYRGVTKQEGGGEFLAALASRQTTFSLPGLLRTTSGGAVAPENALDSAIGNLARRCEKAKVTAWGSVVRSDAAAQPLARAVLGAMGNRGVASDLAPLIAQFKSVTELQLSIADIIAKAVGLSEAESLVRDFLPDAHPF